MKGFIVTGCVRSGTTHFCDILSKYDNINIWNDGYDFEPFSSPSNRFDEAGWTKKFLADNKSECVGFKQFSGDNISVSQMADRFDMVPIPVLRKDIISVYLSFAIYQTKVSLNELKDHGSLNMDYSYELILKEVGGLRRLRKNAFFILKQYYLWENAPSYQKVYFEDMVEGREYPKLNEFFNRKIEFNLNGYTPMKYEHYTKDWEILIEPLLFGLNDAKKSGLFPDYINKIDI